MLSPHAEEKGEKEGVKKRSERKDNETMEEAASLASSRQATQQGARPYAPKAFRLHRYLYSSICYFLRMTLVEEGDLRLG